MDPKERDSDSYSDSDLRVQRQTSTPPFTPSRSRSPTPHQHYYQHEDRNQDQDQDQRNLHLAPPSSSASNPLNNSPLSTPPHTHTQSLLANLYTTHFLSTWNARGYEFGAILFTASAFPDGLLASSIRGLCSTLASLCLSPHLGTYIDQRPTTRLRTLLSTICVNRLAIILGSCVWLFLVDGRRGQQIPSGDVDSETGSDTDSVFSFGFGGGHGYGRHMGGTGVPTKTARYYLFAAAIFFGVIEKLSGIGNTLCVERDWVPVLAAASASASTTGASASARPGYDLTRLNAGMRRIDLVCKLVAPLVLSVIISASANGSGSGSGSMKSGVVAVAGMSCLSWGVEVWSALRVWRACPELWVGGKEDGYDDDGDDDGDRVMGRERCSHQMEMSTVDGDRVIHMQRERARPRLSIMQIRKAVANAWHRQAQQLRQYFSTDVWIPSLSLALLHLSALSYSATFITYLMNGGVSLMWITVARALGSVVEVSSTFVAPVGIQYLAQSSKVVPGAEDGEGLLGERATTEKQHAVGLERLGLWGIGWQLLNLMPVVFAVWQMGSSETDLIPNGSAARSVALASSFTGQPVATISVFFFLSASRLGLWVFDLTSQEITQTRVPPNTRATFAGTEMSFVSFFELGQWILAAILSKPDDFRWLALGSFGAVGIASVMYAFWVRQQRGHLTHWDSIRSRCDCAKGRT